MKTKTSPFLILFLFLASFLSAQVPQGIPYQAMIRGNDGAALANANVTVRFTLHQNTTTGAVEYQETQALTTNAYGLINTQFGTGTPTQGTFAGIVWPNTNKFIQVEANDGDGFVDMGTQQMMSVPYAMYAAQSGNNGSNGINGLNTFQSATQFSGTASSSTPTIISTLNLEANQAVRIEGWVSRISNTCNCNDGSTSIGVNVISGQISNFVNSGIGGQTSCSTDINTTKGFILFRAETPSEVQIVFTNSGSLPNCSGSYNLIIIK